MFSCVSRNKEPPPCLITYFKNGGEIRLNLLPTVGKPYTIYDEKTDTEWEFEYKSKEDFNLLVREFNQKVRDVYLPEEIDSKHYDC